MTSTPAMRLAQVHARHASVGQAEIEAVSVMMMTAAIGKRSPKAEAHVRRWAAKEKGRW